MKVFGPVVLLIATFFSPSKGDKSMYKMVSYDNENYKVMWKYDMLKDEFHFNVTVNATGWVGFGVSEKKGNMMNYDVMVGGFSNNSGYAKDYLTTGFMRPMPDKEQNYMMMSASEMNGYTNLVFYRKRDTGDAEQDVVIKPGMMYLIWAYHKMYDVNHTANGAFMKHTAKGAEAYTFIDPDYVKVNISDNYRLYWKYDKNMDMFYFKIVVKAEGWVAFGVSNNVGGMKGYDVMIGGVRTGGTGYIGDYMTKSPSKPPRDSQQDFEMMGHEQRDGYTMLSFKRKRDTGDMDSDLEITTKKMYIIWAYHNTNDVTENDGFDSHSKKGSMEYTFQFTPPGTTMSPTTSGSTAMYVPSIFGVLAILFLKYVIGA